jgi:hypothetical protein
VADPGAGLAGSDVLILGAGFSRAVSSELPLVDELGNLCLTVDGLGKDPRVPLGGFSGGTFETWLSRLADEQPYLSVSENLENQALFQRFSAAIADVLGARVHAALAAGCPAWLGEFVRVAHQRRACVITFNYDPLIECAAGTGLLYEWGHREPVFWAELTGDVPNWPPGPAYLGATPTDTLRLLKLHGSLNWYWSPGDSSGVSIARRGLPGVFGAPERYTEEQRRRSLPGRVPFVVPPSAVKSPYYRNPVIREIWQQAAVSLQSADRIFILGYSLPPADLTFAGMLVGSLLAAPAPITVVDPRGTAVRDRLDGLGFPGSRIRVFDPGPESHVAAFSAWWRDEASTQLIDRLRNPGLSSLDDPMMVVWGTHAFAAVTEFSRADGVVTLATDPVSESADAAVRARDGLPHPVLPSLGEALRAAAPGDHLAVRALDGRMHAVIGSDINRTRIGYGRGIWNALIPSGTP